MPQGWVLPAIVERVVDFGTDSGIPRRRLEGILGARDGARVTGGSAHAVLAYVVRELDDPSAVWQFASRARPGDYGPYGFVLQASDTLGEALSRASRFFSTIATTAEMVLSTGPRTMRIAVERRDGATSRGAELGTQYVVAQVARLILAISGDALAPSAIRLQRGRIGANAADRADVLAKFESPATSAVTSLVTAIEIDRALLDVPLPRRDPDLARHFDSDLARHEDPSVRARTRRAVESAFELGRSIGENDIARAIGLGTRTLRRRLAEEGTTLREVLDAVRFDLATARLARSEVSLARIAFELGFSDQTALSRAFRRWSGQSPAEFRRAISR
ncbi:MAG: helix-turn-helix domain-containing protein [Polyangiaceae bacterium]